MIAAIQGLNPVLQAFLATLFTWGMTALGAAGVYAQRLFSKNLRVTMLGFASGVMIAASFWSLLLPAIELSREMGYLIWLPALVGFLVGGAFLLGVDALLPHLQAEKTGNERRLDESRRSALLVLAITLHNFPEGLAVGVAFGAVAAGLPAATLPAAVVLAIGIGLQNLPEGLAVSMPLRASGMAARRSFFFGQLSGVVEPVAGVLGAFATLLMRQLLPYVMAFAAGAMIYVVVEELIPESQNGAKTRAATLSTMIGFALMMVLDIAFG